MKFQDTRTVNRSLPPSSLVAMRTARTGPIRWDRTSRVEQVLLFSTVALLPLENHIPAFMGIGFMFYVFAVPTIYVLWNRIGLLDRVWAHPVFLSAYGFLVVITLLEVAHPYADYSDVIRAFHMILGAVVIACLSRDQSGLRAGLYGWIAGGLWVTIVLLSTGYDQVRTVNATDFESASEVREQAFKDTGFNANVNGLAFFAAQGAIVALAFGLKEQSAVRRIFFLVVTLLCVAGSMLTMSRGGVMILVTGCTAIVVTYGLIKGRMLVILGLLAVGILLFVPQAVFSRLVYKAHSYEAGKLEGRTQVYTAALESLPEYVVTGVGAGHFWKSWGANHGFAIGREVVGSHNCFAQVTIYWGVAGLLGLLLVVYQAYRYFPRLCGSDAVKLGLLGTSLALLPLLMVIHNFYEKIFSLGLGFMVGAIVWVWPRTIHSLNAYCQESLVRRFRKTS
jgi:hypothetical protein